MVTQPVCRPKYVLLQHNRLPTRSPAATALNVSWVSASPFRLFLLLYIGLVLTIRMCAPKSMASPSYIAIDARQSWEQWSSNKPSVRIFIWALAEHIATPVAGRLLCSIGIS